MKQYNQLSAKKEKAIIKWQYGAVALMFVLFLPAAYLSIYIFNGSIKYIFLPLSIPLLFIGISAIKNQVFIIGPRGKNEPSRGGSAVGFGILLIVFSFVQLLFIFVEPLINSRFPQVAFDNLPISYADESNSQFYQAVESPTFVKINTFYNISAWGNYKAVPLAIVDETVLIAGNISAEHTSEINLNVINANVVTGEVNWQAVSGSGFVATNSNQVYVETENQPFGGATGIVSYDVNSGEKIWETTFDWESAIGIGNLTLANNGINTKTYHRAKDAFYVLDKDTGEITTFVDIVDYNGGFTFVIENGTTYKWFGRTLQASGQINWKTELDSAAFYDRDLAAPIIIDDLIIVKNGYRFFSPITAVRKNDGEIIWQFEQNVVSNVAVGGNTTYFLTEHAELVAIDTQTGKILNSLNFTPNFSENFDFVNTSIYVAADGDIVAIYFEDTRQLSIFRFVRYE